MSLVRKFSVALLLATLCACVTLPQASFDTRLATAYQTVTTVRTTAASLVQGGKLSSTQGQQIMQLTDGARVSLDAAAKNKDEGTLDLALAVLKTVEGQLK